MDDQGEQLALHQRTQTICLLILAAAAIGGALYVLRPVLVPFVLALFLSVAVSPVMDVLHLRLRLPRGLSIAATVLIGAACLLLMGSLVSASLGELASGQEAYVSKIDGLNEALTSWVERNATEGSWLEALKLRDAAGKVDNVLDPVLDRIPSMVKGAIAWAADAGLTLLSRGVLVFVFMMFLITGYRGPAQRDPDSLSSELRARVKEYLRVKVIVSALTGLAVYAILRVIGIDLALVFGLAAFLLNFIPNIGSVVAVLLPLPVVLLAGDSVDADGNVVEGVSVLGRVLAIALPGLVQFLVGNVIEPKWMGSSLDLNPVSILLSLIFWGLLWGPVGMLLAVPITSILKLLLERLSYTRPIARLLADAPPVRAEDLAAPPG